MLQPKKNKGVAKFAYGGLLDSEPPVKKFTGLKKTKAPKDEVKLPPLRPELLEQLRREQRIKERKEKTKDSIPKLAYGGTLKNNNTMRRLPANKRHIAPALIGAGMSALSTGVGLIGSMNAAKEAKRAEERARAQAYSNKFTSDAQYMEDYNVNGDLGVEYYAKGGQLSPSSTKGNLDATGGNLIPLNSNTQVASGNTHGENTIDGEYGITLNNGQEDIAEIEDKEVIVDDQMVFSDRLKYNKGVTYAKKAKQIATKAGKLEERLNKINNSRERNSIERQLAGTTMANRALFADQEATQIREGKGELDKLAYGGPILPDFKNTLTGKYNHNRKTGQDNLFKDLLPTNMNSSNDEVNDKLGNISEDVEKNHAVIPNISSPSASLPSATQLNPTGRFNNVPIDDTKDSSFMQDLAPSLIDNVGNLALTAMTPKLPKPMGKIAPRMETRVNVNPQLASIENADNTIASNINSNTNNSVVARSAVTASRLRGRNAKLGILAEKENTERGLRNQRNAQVADINNQNTDITNNHNNNQFTRQNDIQSRLSGNLADMAKDIKGTTDNRNKASVDEQILMLDLLNDPTGVKSKMMERNGYYKGSKKFRAGVKTEQERRRKALADQAKNSFNDASKRSQAMTF